MSSKLESEKRVERLLEQKQELLWHVEEINAKIAEIRQEKMIG